ncbi:DUF4344 domain-containing metallopeptidase [Devosia sp. YIM 151766]|uniref:DUF4344 domain-containing metallopeptidase n=1 Tax=Devosia sp. YIM 151766 TaxID=3017325 RepID=UPI00255CA6BA|nr:DUF4344 domain-containing metallopeptidase [Devosia sp. YIM 151766]WIY53825.1 DUF4344 domain-containing metallopeptidase [Devosia sp. YIM 151766]
MRRLLFLLTMLLAGLVAAPLQASDVLSGLSKVQRAEGLRFAVNNSLFTLYHEVAHLLVDKLNLPVLGREEDAADNIATWILLQKGTPDANQTLEDAAKGWMLSSFAYGDIFNDDDYAAGYSPDRHRSMQIVCMMVGADGAAFRPVANSYAMQAERQRSCHFDYEAIDRSIRALLDRPGSGTQVDVRYHDGGRRLRMAERVFRSSGIFDEVAEEVRRGYRLDGKVKFTARRCGEPNAFYDIEETEVIFCYELVQDFLEMYVGELPAMAK